MKIDLYLDHIIHSLQQQGGISVRWTEMMNRLKQSPEFKIHSIGPERRLDADTDPSNASESAFGKQHLPSFLDRYFNPNIPGEKGIFHSSYYRICRNKAMVNLTTVHDFTYEHFRTGLPLMVHHHQKQWAINSSYHLITVSDFTRQELLNRYPKISENRVTVIPNGVNPGQFFPLPKGDTGTFPLPFPSGTFLLFVGERISRYKNFIRVMEVAAHLNLPLLIIGGGPLKKAETIHLTQLLGPNRFAQLNNVATKALNFYYNHALCLLYLSMYEGFGIPVIEAQSAGCPVVCLNSSALPEVAGEGAQWVTENSLEAIVEAVKGLMEGTSLRNALIEKGKRNAQQFTWDRSFDLTVKVYQEIHRQCFE
ncbi:MAG: glycosyltransferase family 4 protein [Marinilabiliales bacterium]|nr:glycosyltransferase family 4 protein [Marinilabiliales bacterium]